MKRAFSHFEWEFYSKEDFTENEIERLKKTALDLDIDNSISVDTNSMGLVDVLVVDTEIEDGLLYVVADVMPLGVL